MTDEVPGVREHGTLPSFRQHPLRGRLLAEMHARPFAPLAAPHRVIHLAFMTDEEAAGQARARLAQ